MHRFFALGFICSGVLLAKTPTPASVPLSECVAEKAGVSFQEVPRAILNSKVSGTAAEEKLAEIQRRISAGIPQAQSRSFRDYLGNLRYEEFFAPIKTDQKKDAEYEKGEGCDYRATIVDYCSLAPQSEPSCGQLCQYYYHCFRP